jgi:hypothetical protein
MRVILASLRHIRTACAAEGGFAGQADVLKTGHPDAMPALVKVRPEAGASASALGDILTQQFPSPAEIHRLIRGELPGLTEGGPHRDPYVHCRVMDTSRKTSRRQLPCPTTPGGRGLR